MISIRRVTVTVAAVVLAGAVASQPGLDAGPVTAEPPQQLIPADSSVGTGRTVTVPAGGNVQAAVDAARPGDTIVLVAGAT